MDRLKQIESFVSVALKGSLTAAAMVEGVAPAVMGRRIDALESRLGVKLLVRTTRRITLTHEGSAFLEDCQHLLTAFADAASVRRVMSRLAPSCVAMRASSSSSGSFISQCARRRSNSACGPPPSKPRAHSQT